MTKLTIVTAAFLALSTSFVSCKKDDDNSSKSKSNTEKITAHDWLISKSVIDPKIDFGNGPSSDGLLLLEECERENIFAYTNDGDYLQDEGVIKCDQFSDQRSVIGTWEFNDDETKLIRNTKAFGIEEVEIVTLTEGELVIKGTQIIGGQENTYVNTYIIP